MKQKDAKAPENWSKAKPLKCYTNPNGSVTCNKDIKQNIKNTEVKKTEVKKPEENPFIELLKPATREEIEILLEAYDRKKLDEPVPFQCYNKAFFVYMIEIMKNHKNDCLLIDQQNRRQSKLYDSTEGAFLSISESGNVYIGLKKYREAPLMKNRSFTLYVLQKYEECKIEKKALCLPLMMDGLHQHANMLVFNYNNDTIEHFEPHGRKFDYMSKDAQNRMATQLKEFARLLGMKYEPPINFCPIIRGFQLAELEAETKQRKYDFGNYQVTFSKDKGYCCAWSLMFMDLRLSNLKISVKEMNERVAKKIKNNPKLLLKYIRGLTNDLLRSIRRILQHLKRKVNNDFKKTMLKEEDIKRWLAVDYSGQPQAVFMKFTTEQRSRLNLINKYYERLNLLPVLAQAISS
tara:strand:- start:1322 stop:2536 length:1215 start_codon:yes stop_codon:yes gene_type:complete